MSPPQSTPAWRDPHLWAAAALALALRVAPMIGYGAGGCTRDECSYRVLARAIADGEPLAAYNGWLWAPGYPYLLAFFEILGSLYAVKGVQVALGVAMVGVAFLLGRRLAAGPAGRRAGRVAAWGVALHPTLAWYAGTLWSEALYATLLLAGVLALLWSRDGRAWRALVPGALVGMCVLFRGVATYMGPIFALAALWPVAGQAWLASVRARWAHAAVVVVAAVAVVGPWSVYASATHGGFIVSDATLGQMMYLGNNDFQPVTFDYGTGLTMNGARDRVFRTGRPHCSDELPPAQWSDCEVAAGRAWIAAHPGEFLRRVPVRLAQLLDPHSFLTRHLRWGKWVGFPWLAEELVVAWIWLTTVLIAVGGTAGAWARARGPYGVLAVGIVGYHVAAVATLAGLTRYRLPLEPLWLLFLALLIASPRESWEALRGWRGLGLALTLPPLIALLLWYLPTGYPGFY